MLAFVLIAVPLEAEAQATGQRHRVGLLDSAAPGRPEAAFREGLRARGYVEGGNVVIDSRFARGHPERLAALVRELLGAKPEVIVTFGLMAAQAAKAATTTTPIVMAFAGDPVGTRLVASLARPGGNVTGMSLATPELAGKRLELLKEVVPKLTRLSVLGDLSRQVEVQETQAAARALGLTMALVEFTRAEGLERALAEASPDPSGGVARAQQRRHDHASGPDHRLRAEEPPAARQQCRPVGDGGRLHELRAKPR
jgi:putative ABC transport system substrate-binding protein